MFHPSKQRTLEISSVLLSLFIFGTIPFVQSALLCLSCEDVREISDCLVDLQHLVECDEHCLVTRNMAYDGNFTYTLGCGNITTCGTELTTTQATTISMTTVPSPVITTSGVPVLSTSQSAIGTTTTTAADTVSTSPDTTTMQMTTVKTTTPPIKIPTHNKNGSSTTHMTSTVITPLAVKTTVGVTKGGVVSMTPPTGGGSLVGKRDMPLEDTPLWLLEKGDYCHQCCQGPQCNQHALKCVPGACYDEIEDCDRVIQLTSLCNDTNKAKQLCKLSCNLCNLVDGQWADWTTWSQCDVTCGNGTISRTRNCSDPAPANGGSDCEGSGEQTDNCVRSPCPEDGNWSFWSSWNDCSKTCGVGLQSRDRTCDNPIPDADGLFCSGEAREYVVCYRDACQDGHWLAWESWGQCSSTCGNGLRTRTRDCTTVSLFGHACIGDAHDTEFCKGDNCPDTSAFTATGLPIDGEENATIILSLILTNVGSDYNVTTGEFICRVPGIYNFFVSIEKQLNVSESFCHLLLNGNSTIMVAARTAFIHSDAYVQASNSANLRLHEGDVVKLGICTAAETFTKQSTFTGNLIEPTN